MTGYLLYLLVLINHLFNPSRVLKLGKLKNIYQLSSVRTGKLAANSLFIGLQFNVCDSSTLLSTNFPYLLVEILKTYSFPLREIE